MDERQKALIQAMASLSKVFGNAVATDGRYSQMEVDETIKLLTPYRSESKEIDMAIRWLKANDHVSAFGALSNLYQQGLAVNLGKGGKRMMAFGQAAFAQMKLIANTTPLSEDVAYARRCIAHAFSWIGEETRNKYILEALEHLQYAKDLLQEEKGFQAKGPLHQAIRAFNQCMP